MKILRFVLVYSFVLTVVCIVLGWAKVLGYSLKPNLWLLGGSFILAGLIAFIASREVKRR